MSCYTITDYNPKEGYAIAEHDDGRQFAAVIRCDLVTQVDHIGRQRNPAKGVAVALDIACEVNELLYKGVDAFYTVDDIEVLY